MSSLVFIPRAYPLSEFDYTDEKRMEFSDDTQERTMYSKVDFDMSILNLLANLEDRYKVVLMYLLLREMGFEFTHEDCAKTMSISRQVYMKLVKSVKERSRKILKGVD